MPLTLSNLTLQKKQSSAAVSCSSEEKEMYLDTFDWVRPLTVPGSRPDDIQGLIHTASAWRPAVILQYGRMKDRRDKWGGKRDSQEGPGYRKNGSFTSRVCPVPGQLPVSLSENCHLLPGLITSSLIVPSHPLPQAPSQHLQAMSSPIRHFSRPWALNKC